METLPKTKIVRKISKAIEEGSGMTAEFVEKKTGRIVSIAIEVKEQESFVDANGVKWVRACE